MCVIVPFFSLYSSDAPHAFPEYDYSNLKNCFANPRKVEVLATYAIAICFNELESCLQTSKSISAKNDCKWFIKGRGKKCLPTCSALLNLPLFIIICAVTKD